MSIFQRIGTRVREALAVLVEGKHPRDPAIADMFRIGQMTAAGQPVSPTTALTISAVYAAVELKSAVRASLPICTYRNRRGAERQVADRHPAYRVLAIEPNPEMTPKVFWQTLEIHRLLWGNAYAEIVWDGAGKPRQAWPLEPWRVVPFREDGQLLFRVDGKRVIHDRDILRFPKFSLDGVHGRSVITWARESLGLSLAAEHYGASFFGNGGVPSGVLEHPGTLDAPARKNIRDDWRKAHAPADGGRNNELAILWEGMKYNKISLPPGDAQFLDTRQFQIVEIARWFNVPPHMLRDLSRSTFANIEHQQIEFVVYSLMPDLVEAEQEINRKMLNPPRLYCKHNVRSLLRGDMASQSKFFREMFGIGVYSINQILELLDDNPIGPDGDRHFVPLNMVDVTKVDEVLLKKPKPGVTKETPVDEEDESDDQEEKDGDKMAALHTALEELLSEAVGRMLRKEAKAALRAANTPAKFLSWLDEFYPHHAAQFTEAIARPVKALLAAYDSPDDLATVVATMTAEHCEASRNALLAACECSADQLPGSIERCVSAWESTRLKVRIRECAA